MEEWVEGAGGGSEWREWMKGMGGVGEGVDEGSG